jgi:hypothetical protein
VNADGFTIAANGGGIAIKRVRPHDDKKIGAADYIEKSGLAKGARLGG